jgi:hypothetical protein
MAEIPARAAGISALYLNHRGREERPHFYMDQMWQRMAALTAASSIDLQLSGRPFRANSFLRPWPRCSRVTMPLPAWTELVRRLTALDISVASHDEVATVCSLAALRHLQLDCTFYADRQLRGSQAAAYEAWQW